MFFLYDFAVHSDLVVHSVILQLCANVVLSLSLSLSLSLCAVSFLDWLFVDVCFVHDRLGHQSVLFVGDFGGCIFVSSAFRWVDLWMCTCRCLQCARLCWYSLH